MPNTGRFAAPAGRQGAAAGGVSLPFRSISHATVPTMPWRLEWALAVGKSRPPAPPPLALPHARAGRA